MTNINIQPPSPPEHADTIQLRNIQLPLPIAPDSWHRPDQPQPCTASLRLSYSSSEASAAADDVRLTIDYGKLYRRIVGETSRLLRDEKQELFGFGSHIVAVDGTQFHAGEGSGPENDARWVAGIIADCAFKQLDESAPDGTAIRKDFGEFEVRLHLPKAILRADGGLYYRSTLAVGNDVSSAERRLVITEEEFSVTGIRCYCILGINPHERREKQAVLISLRLKGPALQQWRTSFVTSYQDMIRAVAERVEATSYGSVESLAELIARVVTVEHGNGKVTVLVEKPNALPFVEGPGLEITRSRAFFKR